MLRTRLPDARVTPRFAGICTFGRFPLLAHLPAEARPVDWIVYGVPYDSGVTFRPGARFGPRAIRDASQYLKPYSIEHDVNICEVFSLADGGDAPVRPFEMHATLESVVVHAGELRAAGQVGSGGGGGGWGGGGEVAEGGSKLLALGGDHSIAYANIRAAWERAGCPAGGVPLIHFDSHLDTVDTVWGEKWSHASVFIRAIEDGLVDSRRMLSIGVKGPLNTARDLEFARDRGVTLVTFDSMRRHGTGPIDRFLDALGEAPAYLTFDIDCIDPAFAPGTGTPSVGGFTSAEALSLLRHLARTGPDGRNHGLPLLGADVVEVLPDRDVGGATALLAAHVAFEILCLDATHRRARGTT